MDDNKKDNSITENKDFLEDTTGCFMVYSCKYDKTDRINCKYYMGKEDNNCAFFDMTSSNFFCDNEQANYRALQEEINSFFRAFNGIQSHNVGQAIDAVVMALSRKREAKI